MGFLRSWDRSQSGRMSSLRLLSGLLLAAALLLLWLRLPNPPGGSRDASAPNRPLAPGRLPQRIVSLSPSITEILFAIGAGNRLIAVTPFCEYPPEAQKLPRVGGESGWNIEFLRKLNPDLVLASVIVPADTVQAIRSSGITVLAFQHAGMKGTLEDIRAIGSRVGSAAAEELLRELNRRQQKLQARVASTLRTAARPRALLLYGMDGLFSAGKTSFAGEILEFAGGRNIAAAVSGDWPQLSMEFIIRENPEVLLLAEGYGKGARGNMEQAMRQIRENPSWQLVSAVQSGRVHLVENQLLSIPGPRMIEAAEKVFAVLHPERKLS